jgi:hypothetical protein
MKEFRIQMNFKLFARQCPKTGKEIEDMSNLPYSSVERLFDA